MSKAKQFNTRKNNNNINRSIMEWSVERKKVDAQSSCRNNKTEAKWYSQPRYVDENLILFIIFYAFAGFSRFIFLWMDFGFDVSLSPVKSNSFVCTYMCKWENYLNFYLCKLMHLWMANGWHKNHSIETIVHRKKALSFSQRQPPSKTIATLIWSGRRKLFPTNHLSRVW